MRSLPAMSLIRNLSSRRLSRSRQLETITAERDALKEENEKLKAELRQLGEEQEKVRSYLRAERAKLEEEHKRLDYEQQSLKLEQEQLAAQRERIAEATEGWGVVNDGKDLVRSLQPRPKLTADQLAPSNQQQERFGRRMFSPGESSDQLSTPPSPRSGRDSPDVHSIDTIGMPPASLSRKGSSMGSSKGRRRGSIFDMFVKSKSSSSLGANSAPPGRLLRRRGSALDRAANLIGVPSSKSSPTVYGSAWSSDSGRVSESDPNYERT